MDASDDLPMVLVATIYQLIHRLAQLFEIV
jgi:hypothetical protein